ncbi:MAG: outer membrane beta-barrel protein [Pseudomonadota bacterium]
MRHQPMQHGLAARDLVCACLLVLICCTMGWAQTDENRDQRGTRLGGLILSPTIDTSLSYNDNIFSEEGDPTDSLILRFTPAAEIASDWRRHSIALAGEAEIGRFLSSPEDNYIDGSFGFEGTVDATRATRARLNLDISREHEERGSDDAPLTLNGPVELLRIGAMLTGQYAPGRLRLQPSAGVERIEFTGFQNDRDRDSIRLGALIGWRYSGKTELFAEGSLTLTDFDDEADRSGFDRDNTSVRLLAGVDWDMSRLIQWRLAAGFERRRYDDPALTGFSGPVVEGRMTWKPTRLIEINTIAARRIEETTIAPASGIDVLSGRVAARWDIRRTLDLTADAVFERRDFRGTTRTDNAVSIGIGAEWQIRRGAVLSAGYRHVRERSSAPGEDHSANLLFLGVGYRF